MSQVTFEYSALYYLNQWISKDSDFCEALNGSDETRQLKALKDAAVFYRVARNLPNAYDKDKNLVRYKPVLEVLLKQPALPSDSSSLVSSIYSIRDQISQAYGGKGLLSLTTKFLWLRQKRPIVIYDRQARRALRTKPDDLASYHLQWRKCFQNNELRIQSACRSLRGVRQYSINPVVATEEYIEKIAACEWFQERVLDVYLWHIGA